MGVMIRGEPLRRYNKTVMSRQSHKLLPVLHFSIASQCPPLAGPTLLIKPFFFKV